MNRKTIAAIALRDGEYDSLCETLQDAARLIELAASQGADLIVLPETINLLHRHGNDPLQALALADWQKTTEQLRERAAKGSAALVLPLLIADPQGLVNCFYFLDRDGSVLGKYQKRAPAPGELTAGVLAAESSAPIRWEGLSFGGAICVDLHYPHDIFEPQMKAGVDCFVIPSMTPGGSLLEAYAVTYGVPFVLAYSAWSRILDRDGHELAAGGYRSETLRAGFGSPIQQATINFDAVTLFADFNQAKIQDILRHYGPKVRIRFNQPNCTFLLESCSPDLTVAEVVRDFGLVSRRDHFTRYAPCAHVLGPANRK